MTGAPAKLFWSIHATGLYMELPAAAREQMDYCAELIRDFPYIGVQINLPWEHRRRFLCHGYWLIYSLDIHDGKNNDAQAVKPVGTENGSSAERIEITIKYLRIKG